MNSIDNLSARESLIVGKEMFYRAMRDKFEDGIVGDRKCRDWVNSLIFTQGEIRLEVELNAVNNEFKFGVTPNQANSNNVVFNTERRLPLQDSIVGTEMMLYVGKPSSQADTGWRLRTHGNPIDFTPAAAAALDSTFYSHGYLTVKVNQRVIVPVRSLTNFHYVPQTQQTAALGAGSPDDQFRGSDDAGVTAEPNLVFIGSANNIPSIVLPSNLANVDQFTRAVLVIRGPYAQNSTIVN